MPYKVRGTALSYFSRFYLNHSVMDAEPKNIMMASVYLACKTEESVTVTCNHASLMMCKTNKQSTQERKEIS